MTSIREFLPEDGPAIAEMERLSPEVGRISVRIQLRDRNLGPLARFPGARGYVALVEGSPAAIGVVFISTGITQFNGELVPASYLFGLRVHPSHRRRGVATALIEHACRRAKEDEQVRTVLAAIIEGNRPSLRTFSRAGFKALRVMRARVLLPGPGPSCAGTVLAARSARPGDLPAIASSLNDYYSEHNFWRPRSPDGLRAELETRGHSLQDSLVVASRDGAVVASASVLDLSRVARITVAGLQPLPAPVNRLLAPLLGLLPASPVLVRHWSFPQAQPAAGRVALHALRRHYLTRGGVIVVGDPTDAVWESIQGWWGIDSRVLTVVRSEEPVDGRRPVYLPQ
jgi:GNAT superfamily N-acetyltransferase